MSYYPTILGPRGPITYCPWGSISPSVELPSGSVTLDLREEEEELVAGARAPAIARMEAEARACALACREAFESGGFLC